MAVTIIPNSTTAHSPNVTYTRLPILVEDSTYPPFPPQFEYILDIYDITQGSTYLGRSTQVPNANDQAVFEPSRTLQGITGQDNFWKISGSADPINALRTIQFQAGSQYGTSPSSSVSIFPNQSTVTLDVFNGVLDPNSGTGWDWFGSDQRGRITSTNNILTNHPEAIYFQAFTDIGPDTQILLGTDDYHTVTCLNPVTQVRCSLVGAGQPIIQVIVSGSVSEYVTFGVGPANLLAQDPSLYGYFTSGDYDYVQVVPQGAIGANYSYTIKGGAFDQECGNEYTRFAFINKYGTWDYYSIYNPVRTSTDLTRQSVTLPKLNYNSIATYSVNTRGETQYYLSSKDRYVIDTDFLTQEVAQWLEELLESPSVFVQENGEFVPVVITNSGYDANLSTSRNKLFKYTIEFTYANSRRSRL